MPTTLNKLSVIKTYYWWSKHLIIVNYTQLLSENWCGRHVIRKAIWRISKLEIWNLKSAVSALMGCLSFACFEKKWEKVSWIFRNSSIRHITNSFSYDMPTTKDSKVTIQNFLMQNQIVNKKLLEQSNLGSNLLKLWLCYLNQNYQVLKLDKLI